jgi:hypothetical protein
MCRTRPTFGGRPHARGSPLRFALRALAVTLVALAVGRTPARAAPGEYLPVGDPLEDELRVLDLMGSRPLRDRLLLPHLGLRPLQRLEIEGRGPRLDSLDVSRRISVARLERALGRDAAPWFEPDSTWPSTPRLFVGAGSADQRLELSGAAEGTAVVDTDGTRFPTGTGLHARIGVQVDRWLFFSHVLFGQVEHGRAFADPFFARTNLIAYTDETYIGYTGAEGRWAMEFGRSRWNWGPGEEATLLLSRTSAPITALSYQVHLTSLHLDGAALSATLGESAGEQLAAHRLEWQPLEVLRLGLTETARYHAASWQPLYAIGAIPYILVQRLLVQDEPDSTGALRNNIMLGADATWRVAEGTRVYGELLVDDLHIRASTNPNKFGWQLGWEGVGDIGATRVTWGGEYTRLSRFVYTSFFGRSYEAQGMPLGFPTGPDARRIALRAGWDLGVDWQLIARAARTDKGENTLAEPFVPGSPQVRVGTFEGVVEQTRDIEAGLRWWPASGVDLRVLGGYRWIANQDHVTGRSAEHVQVTIEARLAR